MYIAVGCVSACMCKNVRSVYTFNILVPRLNFAVWYSYSFSNICLHRAYSLYKEDVLFSALYRQLSHIPAFVFIYVCIHVYIHIYRQSACIYLHNYHVIMSL